MNARAANDERKDERKDERMCSLTSAHACTGDGWEKAMTVYVIVQLKMTDRAAYDRYQARFFDVFKKIQRAAAVG